MSETREIHCYEYVNRPYAAVSELLSKDPVRLFQPASTSAAERAEALVAKLKVTIAGLEIGKDVRIEVTPIESASHAPHAPGLPTTAIALRWKAASDAAFFPSMRAELVAYPLSADETQLELRGWYTPPGGVLGTAGDAIVGHRIAQASIHRLLEEIVERLRVATV